MAKPTVDAKLFQQLDAFPGRIPLAELQSWLEHTSLSIEDLQPFARFHTDRYVRNLVYGGKAFQALLLCWRNGQRSPIHDHVGSNCAVKVFRGIATETIFERAPNGMVYATGSRHLDEGSVVASHDDDIHQMSNLQSGSLDLITLHIYSPALLLMNAYSLSDAGVSRYIDPINDEFSAGDGI